MTTVTNILLSTCFTVLSLSSVNGRTVTQLQTQYVITKITVGDVLHISTGKNYMLKAGILLVYTMVLLHNPVVADSAPSSCL